MVIPLQEQSNRNQFDYALQNMRTNTQTPWGSLTWNRAEDFDEAGYNAAMDAWRQNSGGSPGRMVQDTDENGNIRERFEPGTPGSGAPAPDRNAFTRSTWTQNIALSPEQQGLFDAGIRSQQGMLGALENATARANETLSTGFDPGTLPERMDTPESVNPLIQALRQRMEGIDPFQFYEQGADAMYRMGTRYLEPEMDRAQSALEARMAEQGFTPGTPGFGTEMDRFRMGRERAFADARDRAIATGATFGQNAANFSLNNINAQIAAALSGQRSDMARADFGNQNRAAALQEALALRALPFNELASLRTGNQVNLPNMQGTSATPNLPGVDVMGAFDRQYQGQLADYSAGVSQDNALMGGLFGLGSAALMGGFNPFLGFGAGAGSGVISGGSGLRMP